MIINTCVINLVYKNERYRILEYNSRYMLIDCDRGVLGYLCFLFNWIIPLKVYSLSRQEADDLMTPNVNYKPKKSNRILVSVILLFGIIVIPNIIEKLNLNLIVSIFLNLVVISLSVICIRIIYSRNSKLIKYSEFDRWNKQITLKPSTFNYYVKAFFVYTLFLVVAFVGAILFVVSSGYWIISISYAIVLYLFLLTNRLAYNSKDYKILIKKEK